MEDESKSEWKITSIGAMCASKWSICLKTGFDYLASPLDNVENKTLYQFENIIKLMKCWFSIVSRDKIDCLKERNVCGQRIDLGVKKAFYGYDYIGDELHKPFILTHFFDDSKGGKESFENGWSRFEHKVNKFMDFIRDRENKIIMFNLRVFDDLKEERKQIMESSVEFMKFLKNEYERSHENTLVVNYIITMANAISIDYDDPMLCQIVIPESPDELNVPYYERNYKKVKHIDLLRKFVLNPRGIVN